MTGGELRRGRPAGPRPAGDSPCFAAAPSFHEVDRAEPLLLAGCALSAAGWAALGAARSPDPRAGTAVRGLLGGVAAFGIALGAYHLLGLTGVEVVWEELTRGGARAVVLAAVIGLVEEAAKLAGIALAVRRPERPGAAMAATLGVAAAFAALESALAVRGVAAPAALGRVLLAPVAHAILALPLGFGVVAAARGRGGGWIAAGLLVAASLHAFADLSLALPALGRTGFALALLAPVLARYLRARWYAWTAG